MLPFVPSHVSMSEITVTCYRVCTAIGTRSQTAADECVSPLDHCAVKSLQHNFIELSERLKGSVFIWLDSGWSVVLNEVTGADETLSHWCLQSDKQCVGLQCLNRHSHNEFLLTDGLLVWKNCLFSCVSFHIGATSLFPPS